MMINHVPRHLSIIHDDAHRILADLLKEATQKVDSRDHYETAKEIVRLLQFVTYDNRVIVSELLNVPPK
jgi:hypothetical protein